MNNGRALRGFMWKALERYSVTGIQFLLQILLARLLLPSDFGLIAILSVFISFSNVLVQSGFSTALVKAKKINDDEISSIFNFSLIVAVLLYILLFFFAPIIANFFNIQELSLLIRVYSLSIFPFFFNSIQVSLLRRNFRFKSLAICTVFTVIISGSMAVFFAKNGYGVWTLIFQQLIYIVLLSLLLTIVTKWLPKPILRLSVIKPMINFGTKVLVTGIISELFLEFRTLVIGKMYAPASLAFYNRGKSFPDTLFKNITTSLQAVLLPVLSMQENIRTLKPIMRKVITLTAYVTLPLLGMLSVCAKPLIEILLTQKWLPCVFYIYTFCIYYATWPISTINVQLYYAIGNSGTVLKIEFGRRVIDVVILLTTMYFGVKWIALGAALANIISLPLYMKPAKKQIDYSIFEQCADLFPSLIITLLSCGLSLVWAFMQLSNILLLILQPLTFVLSYLMLSKLFYIKGLSYLFEYAKGRRK